MEKLDGDKSFSVWIDQLDLKLCNTKDKKQRQKFLVFGVIIALIIDYFDPNYSIARRREIYSNKLSQKSKKLIQNELSKHYVPFVKTHLKYY